MGTAEIEKKNEASEAVGFHAILGLIELLLLPAATLA